MDKHHFHEFTGLWIQHSESATNFLKQFTYGKTTAKDATNTYTDEQLVDHIFAGLWAATKDVYKMAIQLYQLEHHKGKIFSLEDIEKTSLRLMKNWGGKRKYFTTNES